MAALPVKRSSLISSCNQSISFSLTPMEDSYGVNQDKNEQTKLCSQDKDHPTNILDNFSPERKLKQTQNSYLSQPNLNLVLSLGSIYCENHPKENPLTRSSSIAGIVTLTNNSGEVEKGVPSLERASSLPAAADRGQRLITMRELQTIRRIEAKNRLIQKQRSFKEAKLKEKLSETEPMLSLPSKGADWAAASAANSPALCRAILKIKTRGLSPSKRGVEGSATPNAPRRFPAGSEGSATPNAPSRFPAGAEGSATSNPQSSFKLPSVPKYVEPVVTSAVASNGVFVKPAETKPENPHKKAKTYRSNFEDNGMDVMRQMPSVSTTGEGPNGRRVDGFLYTYLRGHVCIVCLCHGSFLSPADFVKHAGGKDVANPMKHITVYSTFAS